MADPAEVRAAKELVRSRERAVWTDVERVGRDLRAAEGAKQVMTQAERDAAARKPTEKLDAG